MMETWELRQDIEDKLKDLYRISDHYIPLSQQARFSDYDNAKTAIQEMVDMFIANADIEDKLEELQKKYSALQEAIAEVSNELYAVGEIDTTDIDAEGCVKVSAVYIEGIDKDIASTAKKLEEMAGEDWDPDKKPAKQKRR